jgi:large subunit ribosomal protein L29
MGEIMDIREIRKFSDEKLQNEFEDQKESLFNLRFQKAAGQLEDVKAIPRTRHHIARVLMVLRERQTATEKSN